jgi:aldose 1-epimerase
MYKPNFSFPGQPANRMAAVVATAALALPAQAVIILQPFGSTKNGETVEQVTLENERGMKLTLVDRGAALTGVWVPDRQGHQANVMLSLPTVAAGEASTKRHGAIVGRYAGRIGGGAYTLDGRAIKLPVNAQGAALHGDPNGYEKRVWRRRDFADAESIGSTFELVSPDGDQGHPGRLTLSVTYRLLRKQNEYRIEFAAVTDAPTVLNPANHGYFNLGGAGTHGIASHVFTFDAPRYVLTDAKRVPTGELASVDGTALDFRRGAGVMARMAAKPAELGEPAWYDHALVFA